MPVHTRGGEGRPSRKMNHINFILYSSNNEYCFSSNNVIIINIPVITALTIKIFYSYCKIF